MIEIPTPEEADALGEYQTFGRFAEVICKEMVPFLSSLRRSEDYASIEVGQFLRDAPDDTKMDILHRIGRMFQEKGWAYWTTLDKENDAVWLAVQRPGDGERVLDLDSASDCKGGK